MGDLFSADIDDLGQFVDLSARQVGALSEELRALQAERLSLASSPLPDFVDGTATSRLEALLGFMAENQRFASDISDALTWYGDHVGNTTYLASASVVDQQLQTTTDQRLDQIEAQLLAGGVDPAEASKIRSEIEAKLAADPTLGFGQAVRAGYAAYQGITVEEAERAARSFSLHPAEVASTLTEHFDDVATRHGNDHLIDLTDLHAVIEDPDAPEALRDAAYRVAADPVLFLNLDTAHQTDLSAEPVTVGFAWHKADDRIGRDDLLDFPAVHHRAQILLAWHPLVDTANQGYDLGKVDSHVSADDVIAFVDDQEIPTYVRLAIFDVYAQRHGLDLDRRVELEQELAFAPGGLGGRIEVLEASRTPLSSRGPILAPPTTGTTPSPRGGTPGGGSGGAVVAAIVAQLLVTSAEFGWNQGRQAAMERDGNPRFVFVDPATGLQTIIEPDELAALSPAELRAWVAHQAATGHPPSTAIDHIAPHPYLDVDGRWRMSDTNQPVWSGREPGEPTLIEPSPPPDVYVDANGQWRYLDDGHLWDGYLLSPTQREEEYPGYHQAYNQLPSSPPQIRVVDHDAANAANGAHTAERHGPDIPLWRADADPGQRTIEGRIYGDPPWVRAEGGSHRWLSDTIWQRTVQTYIDDNWDEIRHDLATVDLHTTTFDAGSAVGEGFYNAGMYGAGPRQAVYQQTSFVFLRIRPSPDTDSGIVIVSAYPTARWAQGGS